MIRRRGPARSASNGFTLLELLAALAVGSVVLAAVAGLIRNVGLSFEAGTRNVGHAERLLLGLERIGADLASARYLLKSTNQGVRSVFAGGPKNLAFVSGAGVVSGSVGEEMVLLDVEEAGESSRLVRRRRPWLGHRTPDVQPHDPVVLLEGPLRISFAYSDRTLAWTDRWIDKLDLPRYVRLILRDRATGAVLFHAPDFEIRANAPPPCAKPEATPACIPAATPAAGSPAPAAGGKAP